MKKNLLTCFTSVAVAAVMALTICQQAQAQLLFSAGSPYAQNFDSLGATGTVLDNTTLPGWLAFKAGGSAAAGQVTTCTVGTGSSATGAIYNFGASAATDRALGSVGSGTPGNFAYGVQFQNDTTSSVTNIVISYTGEQWRNGGNATAQTLGFSYQISSAALTSTDAAVSNAAPWIYVSSLNFTSPTVGATAATLDGNLAANRIAISATLSGVSVAPGEYILFRWYDSNDAGNDHGLALDDMTITWTAGAVNNNPPTVTTQPVNTSAYVGNNASFSVSASGQSPLTYAWYSVIGGVTNALGVTSPGLSITGVGSANEGDYFCTVANNLGTTNSTKATLTVLNPIVTNIAYLRTLIDANYNITNTLAVYQVDGVCVTPINLVSGGTVYSFHIEDSTGHGIDVFHRGGFPLPALGDAVRVVAPLALFNGLTEFSPATGNAAHSVTVLSNNAPLPADRVLSLANASNPAIMEDYEGSLVVISNVFIVNSTTNTAFTNLAVSFTLSNAPTQTLTLFKPATATDLNNQPIPTGLVYSIRGVVSQSDSTSPFSSGYQLVIMTYADINTTPPAISETVAINRSGGNVVLSWSNPAYYLQTSIVVSSGYATIPGATSPYTLPAGDQQRYYRLSSTP